MGSKATVTEGNTLAEHGTRAGADRSRALGIAVVALIVLGCALRTAQYLGQVSLWHDELAIALNVEQRDLRGLLTEPLAHRQVAPIGFLAGVGISARLFGVNELSLRLTGLSS